jgi:hypothetical protein
VTQDTLVLPSLSPIGDKPVSALIDDRCTSADVLLLQDVERRLNLGWRLACRIRGSRARLPIGSMRSCACWRLSPAIPTAMTCCAAIPSSKWHWTRSRLCSQPSRIENMPRRPELYRMAMLDLYCDSFPIIPSHLTLDLDESFDRGEQELRKFNAYYDGFLPIHIFDTSGRCPCCGRRRHRARSW